MREIPTTFAAALAQFDLATSKAKEFFEMAALYDAETRSIKDLGPLALKTGWHDVTPELAQNLLRRNRPGANRKIDFPTVVYYAQQMLAGDWKPTGQPLIFDEHGVLIDAQHRLWAILLCGVTIKSFVVTEVPAIEQAFAYIDNGRVRNASAALQTAGFNGVSPLIARVIKIAESVKRGLYSASVASSLPRISPIEMLRIAETYPSAQKAARSAKSDWKAVSDYIGSQEVVGYTGMMIIDLFGEEMADDFFEALADDGPRDNPEEAIAAFRKVIDNDHKSTSPMAKHQRLAALIKCFNAWESGEPLRRRWMLQVNEEFPAFNEPRQMAAE